MMISRVVVEWRAVGKQCAGRACRVARPDRARIRHMDSPGGQWLPSVERPVPRHWQAHPMRAASGRRSGVSPLAVRSVFAGSTRPSSPRELISSFVNTFLRWYWTVRGLMNSRAPISGWRAHRKPSARFGVRAGELIHRRDGALASALAGRQKLALSALRERLHANPVEHLMGAAQLLARVEAPVLAAQPFAVEQTRAGEVRTHVRTTQPADPFAIEALGGHALAQQRP